ncbi:MAG: MFS transporter [Sphaerotilus natans subsp. sulfidivorans]|uniref:MFS transporter n=1 Tax=Sphaerotilus sulfidivorans TaxID=639200 RepID=UPI002356D4BE|nr:MFS transporter [Sphaerotilus sulfidivorans]MCK6401341.1 MFS transporter [Sphaerotilus sulfidivorans]
MNTPDSGRGRVALCIAHCVGLLDLTALPLWIAVLVKHFKFDPQQAGALVTLFLIGGVLASVAVAPAFARMATGRWWAAAGFTLAAVAFYLMIDASGFWPMAALHAVGGVGIGLALSMTHGTVARSSRPHRLFAVCGTAQGVFALAFMVSVPTFMEIQGSVLLLKIFAAITLFGALSTLVGFPPPMPIGGASGVAETGQTTRSAPIPRVVWAGVFGLVFMSMVQAMTFSFLERTGADRGLAAGQVAMVLGLLGMVNLFPAALAGLLERRFEARSVLMVAPVLQALLAALLFLSSTFLPYAVAGSLFVAMIIFAHVFGFGLLARLDTSGRVLSATPAMMMTGAAIGPVVAGTLVKVSGYPAVGMVALVIGLVSLFCFARLPRTAAAAPTPAAAVLKSAASH